LRQVVQVERQKNRAFFMISTANSVYSMSFSRTGPVPESPGPVMRVVKRVGAPDLYPLFPDGTESGGAPTPVAGEVEVPE
jgi:hypothetical protein